MTLLERYRVREQVVLSRAVRLAVKVAMIDHDAKRLILTTKMKKMETVLLKGKLVTAMKMVKAIEGEV